MVVKFLSKYILEVIPSIIATVVGAYIVTHYINAKSDADKPKAAIAGPVNTTRDASLDEAAKPADAPARKSGKTEDAKADAAPTIKPAENAGSPAEPRRHQLQLREKAASKPVVTPPTETAKAEETRDANEIAREAIARLRNSDPTPAAETPRAQDSVRAPEALRPQERARVNLTYAPASQVQAPIQVLPPATTVVPPLNEVTIAPEPQPPVGRADGAFRPPTPPADIPSRPLDLHAKERTSVAEEVVSTAKSVFQAVIPGIN